MSETSTALTINDPTEPLLAMCTATRDAYYDVARNRSRMTAAIVRAQGLQQTIAAANTPEIMAVLLALADPQTKMVERVGDGLANADIVNVMALALWHGFTPGDGEFAIFGTRNGANLYIKGPGYITLLAQLGAKNIRVLPGHPIQHNFKTGQSVWLVDGTAECTFEGKQILLQFSEKGSVKVPCKTYRGGTDSSDNIDGISTKALRRMLKELYRVVQAEAKVSMVEDEEDDTSSAAQVTVTQGGQARLQAPAGDTIDEVAALQTKLSAGHAQLLGDAHADIANATSEQQLRTVWEAINAAAREAKLDGRAMALLTRIKDAKKAEVADG